MSIGKWITGALGWVLGGPIGALLGYSIGAICENLDQRTGYSRENRYSEQRNSFLISLLVLSAAIMKADGKVLRSELEFVKQFIRVSFGEVAVAPSLKILQKLMHKDIDLPQVCAQIKTCMDYSQRLQLLHYLVGIAQADGQVVAKELDYLRKVSLYLGLRSGETESIFSMFKLNDIEDAYKVLEVAPDATDEEVKKAYKRMALKHHPDRVATLGEDVKRAAEEKFKAVAVAYEKIKKERGF